MKTKVEVAANVTVILLAVVIGSVFLMDRFAPGLGPNEVKVGEQLADLHPYNWKAHDRTLVLALRSGCPFCEASMPFYRRLAKLEQSSQIGVHLIAALPDEASASEGPLRHLGPKREANQSPLARMQLTIQQIVTMAAELHASFLPEFPPIEAAVDVGRPI